MPRRFVLIGPVIGLLTFVGGCGGPSLAKVQGRVVNAGAPVTPRPGEWLLVQFFKLDASGSEVVNLFPARVNEADGTFQVIGPEKKGISLGTYRVSVELMNRRGEDRLKGAFNEDNTPFRHEVSRDTPEIILDIASKANSKTD